MIERIKFSNYRDYFKLLKLFIKQELSKITKINYLWKFNFDKLEESSEHSILLFAPSMTIDKPHYLNVGVRNFIEKAKAINIDIELLQCVKGLDICHLGGSPFKSNNKLPCSSCIKVNKLLYKDLNIIEFKDINKKISLDDLSFDDLINYKYKGIEVGKCSLTSISWILRTSKITSNHRDYIYKAITSSIKLVDFIEKLDLNSFSGVLVFNGLTLPESIMYQWCKLNKINVATFESGWSIKNEYALEFNYKPSPQHIFEYSKRNLNSEESQKVEDYLNKKRIGKQKITLNNQNIVSVFGNVSWDTSQIVASSLFNSMFEWLEYLVPIINENTNHLFVFRSHPGENRNIKKTWFGMEQWYEENKYRFSNNTLCYGADSNIDSYDLISKSKFVLAYNSTIAIESAIFGKKAIVAANTHYTKLGFVDFSHSKTELQQKIQKLIDSEMYELEIEKKDFAKSYYFQLLNDVAYEFGKINTELNFNEHTLIRNFENKNSAIDSLDNLLISFVNNKPLEKKFNF